MRKLYLTCVLFLMVINTYAQDTLRTDVVDVVKAFKPVLSDAMKIQSNPNPEIPEMSKPKFFYSIPEKLQHAVTPTVYTIKPLSMGTSLLPKLKNNYTRAGFGNYNMPLMEIYINSVRNKTMQAGVFYKHLSASPSGDNTFSNNTLHLFGKKFMGNGILSADASYHRNRVNVFGQTKEKRPEGTDIENVFSCFDLQSSYSNVVKDTSKLSYKISLNYYRFGDNRSVNENDFKIGGTFRKSLKGNPLDIETKVQITGIDSSSKKLDRVFVDINPRYKLNITDKTYISVGFNSTFANDSASSTKIHFYPTAEAGYMLIKNSLTAFGGITGNLQRHTYRSLATENPFIRQTAFLNTDNTFEFYTGLKGIISPQTSFLLQASFATVKNLMFYAADSILLSSTVIYDMNSASFTNIKAELNHEFGTDFRLGFVMNYFGYSMQLATPSSRPTFTTQTNIYYNIGDKILLRAEGYTMNQRQVLIAQNNEQQSIDGWVDLNTGIEYRYNKNTSLFLNINNLTNNKYQRWYALPVYGINVLGGITVTF
jgi:hypothetical protein